MEREVSKITKSLNDYDANFRKQVERFRAFKEAMANAGVKSDEDGFSISLMDRLEIPSRRIIEAVSDANS